MKAPDVRDLTQESVPSAPFPVSNEASFRLHMTEEVHRGIQEHASADTSVEICGVLVGLWERDDNGPFARVTNYIRCDGATSKFAEVTFTHESWAQINREMDTRFSDLRIIGWYHSHPDFGIFLSDRDVFIQENFFAGAGQVAYVVDPVRRLEGMFEWRDGKPKLMSAYWVSGELRTAQASQHSHANQQTSTSHASHSSNSPASDAAGATLAKEPARVVAALPTTFLVLIAILFFLIGYLVTNSVRQWEQNRIVEGAVAHYGFNKLVKFGLEDDLKALQGDLAKTRAEVLDIREAFRKLPAADGDTTAQHSEIVRRLSALDSAMHRSAQMVSAIGARYGLSEEELRVLSVLVAEKNAELWKPNAPKSTASEDRAEPSRPASAASTGGGETNAIDQSAVEDSGAMSQEQDASTGPAPEASSQQVSPTTATSPPTSPATSQAN